MIYLFKFFKWLFQDERVSILKINRVSDKTKKLLEYEANDLRDTRRMIQSSVMRCAKGIDEFNHLSKFWQKDLGENAEALIKINNRLVEKHYKKYGKES